MKVPPDLLVLDYTLFNHDIFNIYEQMEDENTHIPAIFYNEPCTSKMKRSDFWEYIIQYENCFNKDLKITEYKKIFKTIEGIVENPDLSPYIPLMQKAKPLPPQFAANIFYRDQVYNSTEHQLYDLHSAPGMTPSRFYLLQIFYTHIDSYLTLKDIQSEYEKDKREISTDSLKVQISRLRTIIKNADNCRLLILNDKNGYKLVEFQ